MSDHDDCGTVDVGRCMTREFEELPICLLVQAVYRHTGYVRTCRPRSTCPTRVSAGREDVSVERPHRWRAAITPVVDFVGREPEIQTALTSDDVAAILRWVDRHLAAAEDELRVYRGRHARIGAIAEQLHAADLLDELLWDFERLQDAIDDEADRQEDIDWREERLEARLVKLRGQGIAVTRDDMEELDRYTRGLRRLTRAADRWLGVRVDARDVAGVEPKPSRRSDPADP